MDPAIFTPDDEWTAYLAEMRLLGNRIAKQVLGEEMDGTLEDLRRLQQILDRNSVPVTDTKALLSLGIVLGQVLVNEMPGHDWSILQDDYGKDPCVRFRETTLLVFPQTMLLKRIVADQRINVQELFAELTRLLGEIKRKHHPHIDTD